MSDEATDFARDARRVLEIGNHFLGRWFGPQCADFEPDCECCKRWKLLEALVHSPWQEESDARWAEALELIGAEQAEICDELGVPHGTFVCTGCRQAVRGDRFGNLYCGCIDERGRDVGGDGDGI